MRLEFRKGKKKFEIDAHECSFFERFSGLMFTRKEKAEALLFRFKKRKNISLHSFFVFFDFLAIWLDEKNNVVEIRFCKPWRPYIAIKKPFSKILEIPINEKYEKIVKELLSLSFV